MRLLLDECIDRRFAREFGEYEVKTVPQMGWAGVKDRELLALAELEFDCFVTVDRNLPFEQNLSQLELAVIILEARSNRIADLKPLVPKVLEVLEEAKKGQATTVSE
ncbi:MAG: DUF5615 family PIN-like protein [Cyanobacteria bacterium P01_D01_bin.1]